MNKKPHIGIDVDDVIADFVSAYRQLCHEMFGIALDIEPVDWEFSNFGMTPEQHAAVWQHIRNTENFWADLRPADGASWFDLFQLQKDHTLFFITNRFDLHVGAAPAEVQTASFIRRWFDVEFPTVLLSTDKGPLAAALKLDLFIDDRMKNINAVRFHAPNVSCFLKDASHNRNAVWAVGDNVQRVGSFGEFSKLVRESY